MGLLLFLNCKINRSLGPRQLLCLRQNAFLSLKQKKAAGGRNSLLGANFSLLPLKYSHREEDEK